MNAFLGSQKTWHDLLTFFLSRKRFWAFRFFSFRRSELPALTQEDSCGTEKIAASGSGAKSRSCRKSQVVSSVELLSACGTWVGSSEANMATYSEPGLHCSAGPSGFRKRRFPSWARDLTHRNFQVFWWSPRLPEDSIPIRKQSRLQLCR